ncbi:uncharacterized protein LOC134828653 [Culicoides brevitarsis]|uniref:uncharacterized protein LOC134828653 n=1 Tax=Culicoides brevitarsis TaxID=469753 RepID=UPI00307BDF47
MKFFVFIVLIAAVSARSPPEPSVIAETLGKCVADTEVSPEVLKKIQEHDLNFDDAKGFCFEKCLCRGLGVCDEKFKLTTGPFTDHPKVPQEKIAEFLPKCNELTSENECEMVHMRFKCLFEKIPEVREFKALSPPKATAEE